MNVGHQPTIDAPNPLLHLEERKLTALLPDLGGKCVLDLACGTGRWLEKLSGMGTGLQVGVDFSAAMLRVAEKKAAVHGTTRKSRLPEPSISSFRFRLGRLFICSRPHS